MKQREVGDEQLVHRSKRLYASRSAVGLYQTCLWCLGPRVAACTG